MRKGKINVERILFNFNITQQIGLTNKMIQYNTKTCRKKAMAKSITVIIPPNKNKWISVERKVLKKSYLYQNYILANCEKKIQGTPLRSKELNLSLSILFQT